MKIKSFILVSMTLFTLLPALVQADSQCGPFLLGTSAGDDGWARINGIKPASQNVFFLKQQGDYDNIKMQWMVSRNDSPGWLGVDYIKRNGKAILNVEAIRSNMDQPRLFGTYDCVKL